MGGHGIQYRPPRSARRARAVAGLRTKVAIATGLSACAGAAAMQVGVGAVGGIALATAAAAACAAIGSRVGDRVAAELRDLLRSAKRAAAGEGSGSAACRACAETVDLAIALSELAAIVAEEMADLDEAARAAGARARRWRAEAMALAGRGRLAPRGGRG